MKRYIIIKGPFAYMHDHSVFRDASKTIIDSILLDEHEAAQIARELPWVDREHQLVEILEEETAEILLEKCRKRISDRQAAILAEQERNRLKAERARETKEKRLLEKARETLKKAGEL